MGQSDSPTRIYCIFVNRHFLKVSGGAGNLIEVDSQIVRPENIIIVNTITIYTIVYL